jgi:hypothetical protein
MSAKAYRCAVCRTRRVGFVALLKHKASSRHLGPCGCGGYHFPHRPGSPLCDEAPYVRFNRAVAANASPEERVDAMLDDIFENRHKAYTGPCPF